MSNRPPLTPEDREWLAAEVALGLLDGDELRDARAALAADPSLSADVTRWTGRLAPLLDDVEPREPPSSLLASVERAIGIGNVVDLRPAVRHWRWATAAASALAASLALVLMTQPAATPPAAPVSSAGTPMVAVLGGQATKLVASWDGRSGLVVVPVALPAAPERRSYQLWMIPAGGKPHAMGIQDKGPLRLALDVPTAGLMRAGVTFAISVEPLGGSPTGQPTGAIVASGTMVTA